MTQYKGYPLTSWYPPNIKPVRAGLYIIGSDELSVMSIWDGKQWCYALVPDVRHAIQKHSWRGVAGQPKAGGYLF